MREQLANGQNSGRTGALPALRRVRDAVSSAVTVPLALGARALRRGGPSGLGGTRAELDAARARMLAEPVRLARPVLVLAGYRSWGEQARSLARVLGDLSGDHGAFAQASYFFASRVESAAGHAARVARGLDADEMDVVGISMGGLVGRVLASGLAEGTPRVRRLFTLATPHRGARLAELIRPDGAARSMRPGSAWLAGLDDSTEDAVRGGLEIVPYAVCNDTWVGASRAAPRGMKPAWTPGTAVASHFSVSVDPWIVTDIALRLRGDEPLPVSGEPPPHD